MGIRNDAPTIRQ